MHSAASILASVKEQEARFERLTRALEQERRHVALQLERAQQPGMSSGGMVGSGQPLPMAWQQLVLQGGPRMRKCRGLESAMIIKVSIMAEAHPASSRKKRPLPPPEQIIGLLLSSELLG